jgi:hypothetical protein
MAFPDARGGPRNGLSTVIAVYRGFAHDKFVDKSRTWRDAGHSGLKTGKP